MESVLIDTDVLLDFFLDRKPFSDHASTVLNECIHNKIKGFTTPVIITNVYYILRKSESHKIVLEKLKQLLLFIHVTPMNHAVVIKALQSEFKDFEDALQNFTAIEADDIKIILTRNIKDFKKSELSVLTPETYLRGKR